MASGLVVVRNPREGLWKEPRRLVESLRIGSFDGDGPATFGRIVAIGVDAAGRSYAVDGHAATVRVFDPHGRYLRSFGREGQGPGELIEPVGLAWQDDATLWIVDNTNGRYSVYDTSGTHIKDTGRAALGMLWPWPGRFVEGRLIEPRVMEGAYRLVAIDPALTDAPLDTFPFTDLPPEHWAPSYIHRQGSTVRRIRAPFLAGYVWALDARGNLWGGDTREHTLVRRDLHGDTSLLVTLAGPAVAVSAPERAVAVASVGGPNAPVDLSLIPGHKPSYRAVVPSDDGGAWLIREGNGDRWMMDVLGNDGRYMGTVALPLAPDLSVQPVASDRDLWLVARDTLDVQYLVRLELTDGRPQ